MKKLALAVAVTGALGATSANALVLSESGNGVLVPLVTYVNDFTMGTAISLNSCAAGHVYWTFYDRFSIPRLDGDFPMTAFDQYSFIWAAEAGLGFSEEEGYITFLLDTSASDNAGYGYIDVSDLPCLSGNAFQVNIPHLDVAFQPVLGVDASLGDLGPEVGGIYTSVPSDVVGLSAGGNAHDIYFLRYAIDNIPSDDPHNTLDTTIWIWSATDISAIYHVNMYNDNQERRSVTIDLPFPELNSIDPETIEGRPTDFFDGFIAWPLPESVNGEDVTGVVSWSVVNSTVFGAEQTIINPLHLFDYQGRWVHRNRQYSDPASGPVIHDEIDFP